MIEIDFSTIHNDERDLQAIRRLLGEFEKDRGVRVHLIKMLRGAAWVDLMNIASSGKGPDLSHIGSTWVSSLVAMNAVRPFLPDEVTRLGVQRSFIPSAWQDAHIIDDSNFWAAPWNSFLFVIFYRKDLLAGAQIDEARGFGDFDSLNRTIAALRESSLEIPWLIPYGAPPYDGLLHMSASWVWGAGGDFVNRDGTRVVLDQPDAVRGLTGWLNSQRAVPESYRTLSDEECIELLVQGRATAILSHIRTASALIQKLQASEALSRIGFSTMTDVPWCGGDNIIIWQHTRGFPDRQRAALELVEFLMRPSAQVNLAQQTHIMPTRRDALQQAYPSGHPLNGVVTQVSGTGRAYLSMRLWRRLEYQLAQTLGALLLDAQQNTSQDTEALVRKHIGPAVERLNLVLGN
jgi:multiple sugar transport system substrate-binding protein